MYYTPAFTFPIVATTSSSQASGEEATSSKPTVFVAGATGNVGRRLVRKLAEAGCTVRAGSRDKKKCFDAVGDISTLPGTVEHVQFNVGEKEKEAIGNASVVVTTLGAPFSWGAVDGKGIAQLMTSAASKSTVDQLIVVSSIGVGRPWAFPAAFLNLFGAVLIFKDYSEKVTRKVARQNGKKYLIVRPGGMESPTDDFYLTHNMRLAPRNSLSNGLVSNMQIAELIVAAVHDPQFADGKTVEAIAETDAPKVDYRDLLRQARAD